MSEHEWTDHRGTMWRLNDRGDHFFRFDTGQPWARTQATNDSLSVELLRLAERAKELEAWIPFTFHRPECESLTVDALTGSENEVSCNCGLAELRWSAA